MTSQKPSIVIIPGSWLRVAAWNNFVEKLQGAGFEAEAVPLPTIGGTTLPLAGLADDVAAVQAVVKRFNQEGKRPWLLCHSSGGVIGSNALTGCDVSGLIFLSGFMIPKGKSLLDMLGGQPLSWMDVQGDRCSGVESMLPQVAFNDMDAEMQKTWIKEMTHTSALLFATPSEYEPWAEGVPCRFVFCTNDNALPLPIQQGMAQQLGPDPKTASIDSGHLPFLSVPDKLLAAIETLAV